MSALFEVLGDAETPSGTIRLWRRRDLTLDVDVYEVKLGDEYLMSSLFNQTEIALATEGLGQIPGGEALDVVVGGLGLGYSAVAALDDERVGSLIVVEYLDEVISWHKDRLVPAAAPLMDDPRTTIVHGDFFAMATSEAGVDPSNHGRTFDAILVDIDHTPTHHLDDTHGDFYTADGLRRLASHLKPNGVFALWSDGRPLDDFTAVLGQVFDRVEARVVTFDNVITRGESLATIYVATRRP